ncbi:MAG: bifunctional UDP-N-acetylglucosamine diphosphorylase/glucosamine-1-phosphate N-acetyltransferase GlmU [Steroidobacteraceae bacterium]
MAASNSQSAPLSVVILAAGQGKRMKSALPKVLQPLAGEPLLAHVLRSAGQLAADGIHVVYGHGGEAVRAAFAGGTQAEANCRWVLQAEQLGTGHAVAQALPAIPDEHRVLMLYGDVPLIRAATLQALIELAGTDSLALLTVQLANPTGYGRIVRDAAGQVRRIVEQKDADAAQLVIREGNTGVLVAPAGRLKRWISQLNSANAQREYYLTDVIAMAVRDGVAVKPLVAASESEVLGVNDKLQLAALEAEYRALRARELMLAGVTIIDPARIDLRGAIEVGGDVVLDVNVVLEGPVRLGDRVRVGANSVITASAIGADTVIKPNCVLERVTVGANCQIGPFARLRPDSDLADDVHIGNFVEVKKTRVGRGSKANHLTYLGDAVVGAGVNIGAGTITCNYDGVNKSRTEIGDGAFIGSGSMLVAPLNIGAGATIGAGSTITRPAPEGKLTLTRGKQLTIDGWQRPRKRP